MLREVGEALGVDCSTLVEITDDGKSAPIGYSWCRTASDGDRPFESREWTSLIPELALEREALVLRADADGADSPSAAEAQICLRDAERRGAVRADGLAPAYGRVDVRRVLRRLSVAGSGDRAPADRWRARLERPPRVAA
jgi:hypothetical protein